jgi:hypothetical protein
VNYWHRVCLVEAGLTRPPLRLQSRHDFCIIWQSPLDSHIYWHLEKGSGRPKPRQTLLHHVSYLKGVCRMPLIASKLTFAHCSTSLHNLPHLLWQSSSNNPTATTFPASNQSSPKGYCEDGFYLATSPRLSIAAGEHI